MANTINHPPADILRQLLVDLGQCTLPSNGGSWPAYSENEPDLPDNAVTVQTTQGVNQDSLQMTGALLGTLGAQVRVRSNDRAAGWVKADAIQTDLAAMAARNVSVGSSVYNVWQVLPDDVLSIGADVPGGRRQLFTINVLTTIDQRS